jgi:MFS transporter, ACS family, glucarate transporter
MDCMLPVSWSLCLDVGRQHAGAITGAMNMAGQVGSFLSSSLFGYALVYLYNNDYNGPLVPIAGMLLVSAILYLFIDPTKEIVPLNVTLVPPSPVPVLAMKG